MIRWYDYIASFVAADFMYGNIKLALLSGSMTFQILGILGSYFVYSLWVNTYIPFRVKQENER